MMTLPSPEDSGEHRKRHRFHPREDFATIQEVYRLLDAKTPITRIIRLTGLSFYSVDKLRSRWTALKEQPLAVPQMSGAPAITLSEDFLRSRLVLIRDTVRYKRDPEISMLDNALEELLEKRALLEKYRERFGVL